MDVKLKVRDEIYRVVEKIANLQDLSVEEVIAEGIRTYLQGVLDELLSDHFDIDTTDYTYPILEQ